MEIRSKEQDRKSRIEPKIHLVALGAGLLTIAILPLWRLPVASSVARGIGWPLFASGLVINLLSFLALGAGSSGKVEPVTNLITRGIYAWERHPMYLGFALIMLGLDIAFGSLSGGLATLLVFIPILIWRARLEEQALYHQFGIAWTDYAGRIPSLLLADCRRHSKARAPDASSPGDASTDQ